MHEQTPIKVMLSSTFNDLELHRRKVFDALGAEQLIALTMEFDSALPDSDLIKASLDKVNEADAFIGIIGNRYGQRPYCATRNPGRLSLSELEFLCARERPIPRLMFIMGDEHPLTMADMECALEEGPESLQLRKAFIAKVCSDNVAAYFSSPDHLKAQVTTGLAALKRLVEDQTAAIDLPFGFSPVFAPDDAETSEPNTTSTGIAYYGWAEHAKNHPPPPTLAANQFASEFDLAEQLQTSPEPLVLTGEGGWGKTQLAQQLCGILARDHGWSVVQMADQVDDKAIEGLLGLASRSDPGYIVFADHVDDDKILAKLREIITRQPNKIRVIATCRQSFFNNLKPDYMKKIQTECLVINLSPNRTTLYSAWLKGWRQATCSRIVGSRTDLDNPAIAVIFALANTSGEAIPGSMSREQLRHQVNDLLYRSILSRSSTSWEENRNLLPMLLACFPMTDDTWRSFSEDPNARTVLQALHSDGWVKRKKSPDADWFLEHDLLCDHPLFLDLEKTGSALHLRLVEMTKFAMEHGAGKQLVIAFRRITTDLPQLIGVGGSIDLIRDLFVSFTNLNPLPDKAKHSLFILPCSLSLNASEKLNVLVSIPTLTEFQLDELRKVFVEEAGKFRELAQVHCMDIVRLVVLNSQQKPELVELILNTWLDPNKELTSLRGILNDVLADNQLSELYIEERRPTDIETLRLAEHALRHLANSQDSSLEKQAAGILLSTVPPLERLQRTDEALSVYDAVVERYGSYESVEFQEICAKAIAQKGLRLAELQRIDEAFAEFELVFLNYSGSDDVKLRAQCAAVLCHKARLLTRAEHYNEAIKANHTIIERDFLNRDMSLRRICAEALFSIGYNLGRLDRFAEAVAFYQRLLECYGDIEAPTIQETCRLARLNTIEPLMVLGRTARAKATALKLLQSVTAETQEFSILPFLIWLADRNPETLDSALKAIELSSPGISYTWGFAEIAPVVAALPDQERHIAEAFIAYFEGRQSFDELNAAIHQPFDDSTPQTSLRLATPAMPSTEVH